MNPFSISSISKDKFCNRTAEIEKLQNYMRNGTHVVVYAPRRFGKSSLANVVQSGLTDMENIYVELFSVTSVDEVARLLYGGIVNALGAGAARNDSFLRKVSGFFSRVKFTLSYDAVGQTPKFDVSLGDSNPAICIKDVISSLDAYCKKQKKRACVVLDEFQEICGLKESKQIEAFLREGMQRAEMVSFIFMGSRRTILEDMFENKIRPFYKSTIRLELEGMPHDVFSNFIAARFAHAGHPIDQGIAQEIVSYTNGYAYYTQKLALLYFDALESGVDDIELAKAELIKSESSDCENILVGLLANQKKVLKAIANDPSASIYSSKYLRDNQLGAASSVKTAVQRLVKLDYIEKRGGVWRTVDPILEKWIKSHRA
jgi:AAA+ ATPase superfamily predicted ATPase